MKEKIARLLSKETSLKDREILKILEIPKNHEMGDYAFPCFVLAKQLKRNPSEIAADLAKKISSHEFEKIEAKGPYLNFFINRDFLAQRALKKILKEKGKYGSSLIGKNKKIVVEFSSPNIAKPFGIGHLRSTIIGDAIANICAFSGFKVIRINHLGDWGTQFGKLLLGYKKFGSEKEFRSSPIKHLLNLYVKVNGSPRLENEAREWFKKLESKNKEALALWKKFSSLSLKEFKEIYSLLNIKFDVISSESLYNKKVPDIIDLLQKKNLLKKSQGALVVDLEKYNLGVCLIRKSDETTLYTSRDIAAAIERYKKYRFYKMIYEVGAEQKLHFKQIFKVLELLDYGWAKDCIHVEHGLYLDKDGKRLATRKGKTIFMEDILNETQELAEKEILKRFPSLPKKELIKRAKAISLAAIFYGDLKNHRSLDVIFDIERFLSFEGDTGPYLLYTYARAKSILKKAKYNAKSSFKFSNLNELEKSLIIDLSAFPEIVEHAYRELSPSVIAHYSYRLSRLFNEFYHSEKVIGSSNQEQKLALVSAFSQVLKNSLSLLGIRAIEKM